MTIKPTAPRTAAPPLPPPNTDRKAKTGQPTATPVSTPVSAPRPTEQPTQPAAAKASAAAPAQKTETARRAGQVDDPRAAERLADLAQRAGGQLAAIDAFTQSRVGLGPLGASPAGASSPLSRFDKENLGDNPLDPAKAGKSGAATPFDDYFGGEATKGKSPGSLLDSLTGDGFSRKGDPFSGLFGSETGAGGFGLDKDPLAGLGAKAPGLDPFAGVDGGPAMGSRGLGSGLMDKAGDDADAIGDLLELVSKAAEAAGVDPETAALLETAADAFFVGRVIDKTYTAVRGNGATIGGDIHTGVQAVKDAVSPSTPAPSTPAPANPTPANPAPANPTPAPAAPKESGSSSGGATPTPKAADTTKKSGGGSKTDSNEFAAGFSKAEAAAELLRQGAGSAVGARTHGLSRPVGDGSTGGDSGNGEGGGAASGSGAPVRGLGGDGHESTGGATGSAQSVPRPQNSWDPVNGTVEHQVGVPTYLGQKVGGGRGTPGVG